ncbi:GNAT family N-acetyltransferase [Alteriqipengyuania sp.]|uniref:GNAT family N-acetyltransferase n=1 Tax=Alteriqipengyuania sp. TaxID=2800692 RepID=UPI0035122C58
MALEVREVTLDDPQVRALALDHVQQMRAGSPPGQAFALDLTGLDDPAITLFGAWRGGELLGIGALKQLDAGQAEIKSMRTRADALRQGVARALLDAIIAQAKEVGLNRLSLETGSGPSFEPALALYRARGFRHGDAFSDYENTEFNQCLHLDLAAD